ncbi:MAG: 2-phospho-L-lactate transferase [Candidatus Lambdaproteobacteria bacterium]|nr:2-phospho-L-lactate transferase [Candidatus Lambdaproteobacteria bacterium]
MSPRVTILSGGVGGAKLALGFYEVLEPKARLTVIANTGDDISLFGLCICPDTDILLYTLAGLVNLETGWGLAGDTFHAIRSAGRLGATGWFNLGDRDLGTHLFRTELLAQGVSLTEITRRLAAALGLGCAVLPMCDSPMPTRVVTDEGDLHLQEYLVRRRAEPVVKALRCEGASGARPGPALAQAIAESALIVLAPSNPLISIGPILAVPGLRELLRLSPALKVAVSPIVGGQSLKGPSDRMLAQLGHEVSPLGVARLYRDVLDAYVIDIEDGADRPAIEALGLRCAVLPTVMRDLAAKRALARGLLMLLDGFGPGDPR